MKDLREWMAAIRSMGELVEVHAEVDPHLEITEIADRVMKAGGPAVLFTNVKGSRLPVLINQFGSERRMAMGLGGTDLDQIASRISEIAEMQPPQGVMDKVKALGKLKELASLGTKTVRSGPCPDT
jgi:4-hydroxy-3-polyprenylbenzoate decarboxylase